MNREMVSYHVREVLCSTFGVKPESIFDSTKAGDVEGWDSLSHLVVLTGIEKRVRVKLPLTEAYEAEDVGALVELVTRVAEQHAGTS
jgi:acyl carrier protein